MKKKICIILIAVFVALLGASTYFIYDYYRQANEQSELYDSLAEAVDQAQKSDEANEPVEEIPYNEEKTILPEYAELFLQNMDMVGWIKVEDTNINYPVMHTPDNPDFYLKHGFDKGYTDYGCPYVQENCDVQEASDNIIIYGHHMKNGSMFADLEKFKSEDFYKEHKTISFNMLDSSPVEVEATNELPYPNMAAFYNNEEQTLYVKRDVGDSVAVAQCVAQELGHAQLSINSDSYSRADMGFQAVCIGYMLCKKYGVDTQNFAINRIPEKLAGKEPKDIRYELSKTRNAMADIHSRVSDELYKKKQERSKDYER